MTVTVTWAICPARRDAHTLYEVSGTDVIRCWFSEKPGLLWQLEDKPSETAFLAKWPGAAKVLKLES